MRLKRADPESPGLTRRRRGRGFGYLDDTGEPVTDPELLDRIKALVIPPAWRRVWISPDANGHIQAIGVDAAGRRQYLYHPEWRRARDEEKHDRVLALAGRLPELRAAVAADLDGRGAARRRVLAVALRILDLGVFRTGGEEYAEENGTHGLATLLREHVTVRGCELVFCYPAKGGIQRDVSIRDEELVRAVKALRRAAPKAERLLTYRDHGEWHPVHAEEINERFKELTGDEFTAKDLRTWNATVLAAVAFADLDRPSSERGRKRAEAAVMREVAEGLGNTPAVARRSYVDPRVVTAFGEERTIGRAVRRARAVDDARESRALIERAVVRLLRG
jgi:DNA topoisomerase-1